MEAMKEKKSLKPVRLGKKIPDGRKYQLQQKPGDGRIWAPGEDCGLAGGHWVCDHIPREYAFQYKWKPAGKNLTLCTRGRSSAQTWELTPGSCGAQQLTQSKASSGARCHRGLGHPAPITCPGTRSWGMRTEGKGQIYNSGAWPDRNKPHIRDRLSLGREGKRGEESQLSKDAPKYGTRIGTLGRHTSRSLSVSKEARGTIPKSHSRFPLSQVWDLLQRRALEAIPVHGADGEEWRE